jgi:hypothetical protein
VSRSRLDAGAPARRWWAIIAAPLAAALLGTVGARAAAATPDAPPPLALAIVDGPVSGSDAGDGAPERIALAALSEARRAELARSLDQLAARLQRRSNPLFVPLDEPDDRRQVERLAARYAPVLSTAAALAAGRWRSPEGDITIHAVARCEPAARCYPLTVRASADTMEGRVRFLAWPLGHAALLRAPSDAEATRVAGRLRDAPDAGSRIALVLTRSDLRSSAATPGLAAVNRAAARVAAIGKRRGQPVPPWLASLASARGGAGERSWLTLPEGAILVVPRLGSLASPDDFVAEIRAQLGATAPEVGWLSAPVCRAAAGLPPPL